MSEPQRVHEAIANVMAEVNVVQKGQEFNERGTRYSFRGVDDVINAVGPALRKNQLYVAPVRTTILGDERYETKSGAKMRNVVLEVSYEWSYVDGSTRPAQTIGEAADVADKAISKAASVAYRTMLIQTLCIPTGEPDPDSEVHERASDTQARESTESLEVTAVNNRIGSLRQTLGWTNDQLYKDFADWSNGKHLDQAPLDWRKAFADHLSVVAAHPATPPVTQHVAGGPYPDVPVNDLWKTVTELADSLSYSGTELDEQYAKWNGGQLLSAASPAGLQEFVKQLRHELDQRQNARDEQEAQHVEAQEEERPFTDAHGWRDDPAPF